MFTRGAGMNKHNIVRIVFLSTLFLAATAQAFVGVMSVGLGEANDVGEVTTSFVADAVIETEEMTANARVYYKPGKVRDELSMADQQMVTIRRLDSNKVWTLMPGQNMYMENDVDPEKAQQQQNAYRLISRERVGEEVVNGMQTTKYKSVYESAEGKLGGFTWYTDDNIAVKAFMVSETEGEKTRVKYEFTNLERGSQSDELFEIPAGYQKFTMPNYGDMGSLGGMPGAAQGAAGGYPPPQSAPRERSSVQMTSPPS